MTSGVGSPAESHFDGLPIGIFGHINRLSRLIRIAEKRLLLDFDIELWEYETLAILRRSGPTYQLTPKEIGRATLVSSGALTNRVDHLERAGLVERLPDPRDRRSLFVRLTPAGRERVDGILNTQLERERQMLSSFTTRESETTAAILRKLLVSIEERTILKHSA